MTKRSLVLLPVVLALAAISAPAQGFKATRLNPPGSSYTTAEGVNTQGIVVGAFTKPGGTLQGFSYDSSAKTYKTFTYPGALNTIPLGVNDANVISGTFVGTDGLNHGFFLINGSFSQFDLGSGVNTAVYGVNNAGNFVGSTGFNGADSGFVSIAGKVTKFTFGGNVTETYGIDNSNNVVGFFVDPQFIGTHGFLRDANGKLTQIDFPGADSTGCTGINDAGVITGFYVDSSGTHGFRLMNGTYKSSVFGYISGINQNGDFVGSFTAKDQNTHGFLAMHGGTTAAH